MENDFWFVTNDEGLAVVYVIHLKFVVLVNNVHLQALSVLLIGCKYAARALRSEGNFVAAFDVYFDEVLSPNSKFVDWLSFLIEEGEFVSSLS
jgi:hypothetical protein